jgi:hypothetical protein
MTATFCRRKSAPISLTRAALPSVQRYSIAIVCPSTQPTYFFCKNSGSLATLAAIRRASSLVNSLAAEPARHDSSPPNRLSAAL